MKRPIATLPAEQARRQHNAVRIGTVEEVDPAAARARVKIGDNLTAWLPWTAARAGADRVWHPPAIGEQVVLAAPDGELAAAVILGSLYSAAAAAPGDRADLARTVYADGAQVEYDQAAGCMAVTLPDGGRYLLTAGGGLQILAVPGGVQILGNVTIAGSLSVSNGISAEGGGDAVMRVSGRILATGDVESATQVKAAGVTLKNHTHPGIMPGGGNTAAPNPGT